MTKEFIIFCRGGVPPPAINLHSATLFWGVEDACPYRIDKPYQSSPQIIYNRKKSREQVGIIVRFTLCFYLYCGILNLHGINLG